MLNINGSTNSSSSSAATDEELAKAVIKGIKGYTRRPSPEVPADLQDAGGVRRAEETAYRVANGGHLPSQEKVLMELYGMWRGALQSVEMYNAGTLRVLGSAWKTARSKEGEAWNMARARLAAWLAQEWGTKPPKPFEQVIERWALTQSQDLKALPLWARKGQQPPDDDEFARRPRGYQKFEVEAMYTVPPQKQEQEDDPDD
jgi:hypothetical protein